MLCMTASLAFAAKAADIQVYDKEYCDKDDGTTPTIVAIEAGVWFSTALESDNNLWAWGDNKYGQMATGYTGYRFSEPRIIMTGVSSVSAGKYHVLAVKDGTVYGWGRNAEDTVERQ